MERASRTHHTRHMALKTAENRGFGVTGMMLNPSHVMIQGLITSSTFYLLLGDCARNGE